MSRKKLYTMIADIRYELAPGIHTYGPCRRCRKTARGSDLCIHCRTEDLANLVQSKELAEMYTFHIGQASTALGDMESIVDEQYNKS